MRACAGWIVVFMLPSLVLAQNRDRADRSYPPKLEGAEVETYKEVGDVKLQLYIFRPKPAQDSDKAAMPRPAIVFFFGGGWRSGSPAQFQEHCRYLAERGMIAIAADYRVESRHQVKAVQCVADAKSAIRYVRREASRLGIDPQRIVAAGGSAGGHLAACTGIIDGHDEPAEDSAISSRPNALVLFNPAVVLAPVPGEPATERAASLATRMGTEPQHLSPYHHVAAQAPPTLILHGKEDTTVPYRTVELFAAAMDKAGNSCKLVGYEGQAHGFFNFGRGNNEYFERTRSEMDEFLTKLRYLPAAKP